MPDWGGVIGFDERVQVFLQIAQGQRKLAPQGGRKKILQKVPVEFLTNMVAGRPEMLRRQVTDVLFCEESLVRVYRSQSAIFRRFAGMDFLDGHSLTSKERQHAGGENIDSVRRIS